MEGEKKKSVEGFRGKESLNELDTLLQAMKREADWKVDYVLMQVKSEIIEDISKKFQG